MHMFTPCSHLPGYIHRDFPFNMAHTGSLCTQCFCGGCGLLAHFNPYDCMAAWTMCAWCLCGVTEDIYEGNYAKSSAEAWQGRVLATTTAVDHNINAMAS